MAQPGLERIPLAVDSKFKAQPVRANFPDQSQPEIRLVGFEPDAAPAAPASALAGRTAGEAVADTAYGFAKGAGSLVKGIGWLANSDTIQQAGQVAEDYWGEKQSAELHRQLDAVGKAEGVMGTISALADNPAAIGDYIATSLPQMVPGMGVGSVGARAIVGFAGNTAKSAALRAGATEAAAMQAGRLAAQAAEKSAMRFAVGANMIGEGTVSGGGTGAEVEKFALDHGATPAQAKAAANKSALMAGAWTTAGAGIGAGMETRAMLGKLNDAGVRGLVKNVGKEALEEAIQNPGEDYAGYSGKVQFDPTQTFDPAKSATLGAVTGGIMGGGFHAAGRASERLARRDQRDSTIPAEEVDHPPPAGADGIEGEFIPGERQQLEGMGAGNTYDQSTAALPPGQPRLPAPPAMEGDVFGAEALPAGQRLLDRPAIDGSATTMGGDFARPPLPAPEQGGPSERQIATSRGLLNHSPKASPDLLARLMRVDQTMATMLFNHWETGRNGTLATEEQGNAEMAAPGAEGPRDFIPGSASLLASSPVVDVAAVGAGAEVAAPGLRPDIPAGAEGTPGVTAQDIEVHAAATSPFNGTPQPTEAQKQAGNYKVGRLKFQGIDISIENPAGSVRSGTNADGKAWENTLQHHYGYIRGSTAKDGDQVDAFIKPNAQSARTAYVIDQIDPKTGKYDEAKVILGADSEADAQAIYQANYEEGWQGLGAITAMPMADFKAWIKSGKTKKPLAYVEPKEVRTAARRRPASNTLIQAIINRGGINRSIMQDVGADPKGRYQPGLFTKGGTSDLSELAQLLFDEDGFHQIGHSTDIGPARELEELITRAVKGERILNTDAAEREYRQGIEAEASADIERLANEYGIALKDGTKRRPVDEVRAEIDDAIAFEIGKAGETATSLHKAAIEDGLAESEADAIVDRIADEFNGDLTKDKEVKMWRKIATEFEDYINGNSERIGSEDEVSVEVNAPAEPARAADEGRAEPFSLESQTAADLKAKVARESSEDLANRETADREREAFALSAPEGSAAPVKTPTQQSGLFTAAGTASKDAAQDSGATIAGKPVADMTEDKLRTIARGLSPTYGEAAVDKAKAELRRRVAAPIDQKPERPYATPDERHDAIYTLQRAAKDAGLEYSGKDIKDAAEFGAPEAEIAAAIDAGEDAVSALAEKYAERSNGLRQGFGTAAVGPRYEPVNHPMSERDERIASLTGRGLYELPDDQRASLLKMAKVRSVDAFEKLGIANRREIIERWLNAQPIDQKTPADAGVSVSEPEKVGAGESAKESAIDAALRSVGIDRLVVIDKPKSKGMESRAGYTREAFAATVLQELAVEDEIFRYPVSKSASLQGVFRDVFPGVQYLGDHTQAEDKSEKGADNRYVFLTPETTDKDGEVTRNGKQFEVYTSRDRVWIDVHRLQPGDQGSRIYAAVANFAYNTKRVFGGDPVGVSVDAIMARTKMMLSSMLRFGTARHLDASTEQEKGIEGAIPPLEWRGNDIDKLRSLIQNFIETVQGAAPKIKDYRYDFELRQFVKDGAYIAGAPEIIAGISSNDRNAALAAFDDAVGRDQRRAARIGADSGRAAILIQSLVREEGRGVGDAGILQAILDDAGALVRGGLKGILSKAAPAKAGVSVSDDNTESVRSIRAVVEKFKERFKGAAALDIRVVRTAFEIPARYRPSPFVEGVFHDDIGTIYLLTMNLRGADRQIDTGRAFQVLLHEAVGHYGLAAMMGERFAGVRKKVLDVAHANGPVREAESEEDRYKPGDEDYATVEAVRLRYPEATDDEIAQEVLARMAETDPGRTWFGYARAVVRQWFRDLARWFGKNIEVTTKELNDLVAMASAYMRRGDNLSAEYEPTGLVAASRGMESRGVAPGAAPVWSSPEVSRADDLIYSLQDKHIDLKRVQEGIKQAIGDIRDDIDTYLQEELFHGRAAKATEEFLERELQPFIGEMKARGIDMDSLETYLWARHAAERNAQIAKINPDMPEGGSGLTDQQAADLMAGKDVTVGGKTIKGLLPAKARSYADLAKKVDAMVAGNRMLLELYELETPETVAAWQSAYQHYVPLHREDAETPWSGPGTGMGYSVRGSSIKRATGSFRPVENILANMVLQRTRTITRGEKNRVAQALYGMAKSAPNADFWTTDDAPTVRVVENKAIYHVMDGKTEVANFTNMGEAEKKARENRAWFVYQDRGDRVVERTDPSFRSKPNVVWSRFNGEDRFVIFNERDERAARMAAALKNLDADDISNALGEVARWTRYFASINTQYNPVFGVINLIRDTGTSVLNLSSTPLAGKQVELLGNVYQALPAIYKAVRIDRQGGTPTGTWAQLWEEFQEVGGQTGYRDMFRNSHEQREALEKALDPKWWQDKWWGKTLTLGGVLAVPEQFLSEKIGKPVFEWLSDYNTTMENGIRLSAYKLGLDQGMSKARAASLAKNLTVNFNKKGQVARQVGAMYAFFNASVQGTARMAETLHAGAKPGELLGKAGKQIVYGGMLLGAVQAMLLMMAGFDDDEPPEFVRDRNIIIPIGDKKYLTVAMPLGFHVLPAFGRIATEFVLGGFKGPGEHVVHLFDVLADSFNPIGNAGLSMQTLAPTVLDPAAALAENKDWAGKPIYREDFSKRAPTPGYSRTKDTATAFSKALAYALNRASGGTEFQQGMMSPTPDQIDYLIGQVTGGVGRELVKVEQTVRATITGGDLPPYKIPLLGRFYGNAKGQSAEVGRFYDNLKAMNEHQAELKGLWESDRGAQADSYAKEHPEARMFREADRMQRYVALLRKEKARLEASSASRDRIKATDELITKTMRDFNQRVEAGKRQKKAAELGVN